MTQAWSGAQNRPQTEVSNRHLGRKDVESQVSGRIQQEKAGGGECQGVVAQEPGRPSPGKQSTTRDGDRGYRDKNGPENQIRKVQGSSLPLLVALLSITERPSRKPDAS
jgi:hypothetical protein